MKDSGSDGTAFRNLRVLCLFISSLIKLHGNTCILYESRVLLIFSTSLSIHYLEAEVFLLDLEGNIGASSISSAPRKQNSKQKGKLIFKENLIFKHIASAELSGTEVTLYQLVKIKNHRFKYVMDLLKCGMYSSILHKPVNTVTISNIMQISRELNITSSRFYQYH